MGEYPGVSTCPDCGSGLASVDSDDERPIQVVQRECPDCGKKYTISLCWYPGQSYDIIAGDASVDEIECGVQGCENDADLVAISSIDEIPTYRCESCARSYRVRALSIQEKGD